MIPNIFISSTILDLHHLRDSIRDTIIDIGYTPVMSEYGDIGYLPSDSAEDSCYIAMKDCQLSIFLISKRYGDISKNGLSATHNEFRTARKQNIPVIFLVDEEIMSFKRVYDSNDNKDKLTFPGMDNPGKVFELIREFADSPNNNGLITYSNVQSAKSNIKKQIAHIIGDLLRKYFDPVQNEIKDILTEITTLKHVLLKNEKNIARIFAVAYRELLDKKNEGLRNIIEEISASLEDGVPEILKYKTIQEYFQKNSVELRILPTEEVIEELRFKSAEDAIRLGIHKSHYTRACYALSEQLGSNERFELVDEENPEDERLIYGYGKKIFIANKLAIKYLEFSFERLLNKINNIK
jgi:hypothetical protein